MGKKALKFLIPFFLLGVGYVYLWYQAQRPSEDIEVCKLYFPDKKNDFFKIYYEKEFGISNTSATSIVFELYHNNKLLIPKRYFASLDGEIKKEYFNIKVCGEYYFVTFLKSDALYIICDKNYEIIYPENYSSNWEEKLFLAKEKIHACDSTMRIYIP